MADMFKNDEIDNAEIVNDTPEVSNEALIAELMKSKKVVEMTTTINKLVSNIDFLVDDSWIDHVINGFKKPDVEARVEKSLRKSVRKKMMDEAAEKVNPGDSIPTPTKEDIDKEVQLKLNKRHRDIQDEKDTKLRKARNAILAESET